MDQVDQVTEVKHGSPEHYRMHCCRLRAFSVEIEGKDMVLKGLEPDVLAELGIDRVM